MVQLLTIAPHALKAIFSMKAPATNASIPALNAIFLMIFKKKSATYVKKVDTRLMMAHV